MAMSEPLVIANHLQAMIKRLPLGNVHTMIEVSPAEREALTVAAYIIIKMFVERKGNPVP